MFSFRLIVTENLKPLGVSGIQKNNDGEGANAPRCARWTSAPRWRCVSLISRYPLGRSCSSSRWRCCSIQQGSSFLVVLLAVLLKQHLLVLLHVVVWLGFTTSWRRTTVIIRKVLFFRNIFDLEKKIFLGTTPTQYSHHQDYSILSTECL